MGTCAFLCAFLFEKITSKGGGSMIIHIFFLTITITKREMTEEDYMKERAYQACLEQQNEIRNQFLQQNRGL